MTRHRIAAFATQGKGHNEEERINALLGELAAEDSVRTTIWSIPRRGRGRYAITLLRLLVRARPDLVVMEGTSVSGGAVLLAARALSSIRFVVSSGDAVGPYLKAEHPSVAIPAAMYERLLCRFCAGYVGWTPYLAGRALTLGAPRAMTAPGWGLPKADDGLGAAMRAHWCIPPNHLVIGIVGTLHWNQRYEYCYGLELVRAAATVERDDLTVLIVGGGDGAERLRAQTDPRGPRVVLAGTLPHDEIPGALAAMDIASLPQSVDQVGSFRYSTKLPEYLAAGLPVVTGELPLAYDLAGGWLLRLPGSAPWDPIYVQALRRFMVSLSREQLESMRAQVPQRDPLFDRATQAHRLRSFLLDILAAL